MMGMELPSFPTKGQPDIEQYQKISAVPAFNLGADWILNCQADRSQAKETTFLFNFAFFLGNTPW